MRRRHRRLRVGKHGAPHCAHESGDYPCAQAMQRYQLFGTHSVRVMACSSDGDGRRSTTAFASDRPGDQLLVVECRSRSRASSDRMRCAVGRRLLIVTKSEVESRFPPWSATSTTRPSIRAYGQVSCRRPAGTSGPAVQVLPHRRPGAGARRLHFTWGTDPHYMRLYEETVPQAQSSIPNGIVFCRRGAAQHRSRLHHSR